VTGEKEERDEREETDESSQSEKIARRRGSETHKSAAPVRVARLLAGVRDRCSFKREGHRPLQRPAEEEQCINY